MYLSQEDMTLLVAAILLISSVNGDMHRLHKLEGYKEY